MSEPLWLVPRPAPRLPAVTVVIPSHRHGFLLEAIASVEEQTVKDVQLLIDKRPEDGAFWDGNKVNALASLARARWLCILPDDDQLKPTYLERCLAETNHGDDIVYTDIEIFGAYDGVHDFPDFGINVFRTGVVPWTTALIRMDLWRDLKGYDPDQDFQDTDFWIRAAAQGVTAHHIRERLSRTRDHEGQGSRRMSQTDAILRLQAKHPAMYPSKWVDESPVPPLRVPARFGA